MSRGSINTKRSELVALWIPHDVLQAIDFSVRAEDTDRSKYIRNAIRERLVRNGYHLSIHATDEDSKAV